jgi:hypothetical protein
MDTFHPLPIQYIYGVNKKQNIHKGSRCAITNSSLDCRFLLRMIATVVVTAITTSVHFAVDKLGEVDDEVLVLAGSKREIEIGLVVDRFHEQLQSKREPVNAC